MKTEDHALKIAFIGCGAITVRHSKAVNAFPDLFDVIAVCDAYLPSAEKLAEKLGPETKTFQSIEELYEGVGSELEGVIVATPHFLHEPAGKFFLERGIPALIEKPVTCNLKELDELRALEKDGAFIQAGQMQRFDREAIWLREFVQSEERFGESISFDLNIWQNIYGYLRGNMNHWILDGEKAGGGICWSVGVHPLDALRFITGQDFTEVTATGRFDEPFVNGAESSCSVLLKMSGGLSGTLHASYKPTKVPYAQRMVLYGERGGLYQDARIGDYMGPFSAVSADPKIDGFMDMLGGYEPIADQVEEAYGHLSKNPFASQLVHFREAILEGRKPTENTLEINHNTIAVLEAISASLRSGKTEAVQTL